jgi:chorismate mutase/prephenate dehydratase
MTEPLKQIRDQIDAFDEQLVDLLNQRALLAQRIGHLKQGGAYRPEREAQVLQRVRTLNKGPLSAEALSRLYTEIMSACRALESELAVAYLGPEGTFSEEAVVKHFGKAVTGLPCGSIDETFQSVESGAAAYGVVPVENSTEGAVGRTNDLLFQRQLQICGEVMLPVHQCLMNLSGRSDGFSKIYSHSQSLAQCRGWLNSHYQKIERIAVVSNAEAARLASLDESAAAVAGRIAAERYGLRIVAANIEDESRNITRFVVIGNHDATPSGQDRTSLVMSTRNRPGAMNELLVPLAQHQVSMSRLESRPARSGLWEYLFFVDVEGHRNDDNVARALAEVREKATFLKVLGSYPRAGTY